MQPVNTTGHEENSPAPPTCGPTNPDVVDKPIHRSTNIRVWTKYLHSSTTKPPKLDHRGLLESGSPCDLACDDTTRVDVVDDVDEDTKRQDKLDQLRRNCKHLFNSPPRTTNNEGDDENTKDRKDVKNQECPKRTLAVPSSNARLKASIDAYDGRGESKVKIAIHHGGLRQREKDGSRRYIIRSDGSFNIVFNAEYVEDREGEQEAVVDNVSSQQKRRGKNSENKTSNVRYDNIRTTDNTVQMEGNTNDNRDGEITGNNTHCDNILATKVKTTTNEKPAGSCEATPQRRGEVQASIDSLNECIDEFTRLVHGDAAPPGQERTGDFIKELLKFRF